jgi:hypothetical protein
VLFSSLCLNMISIPFSYLFRLLEAWKQSN